jgi:hypothetical protein
VWAVSIGYTWWATLQMQREFTEIRESGLALLQFFA